ncbi:uncharacterized protein LOC110224614 [Arabidopsis lyrata subsp. lyrata]|uniref:uncharacterized protein LOC110224614 n=1 Tax=Arabidopsis lyrata subsp. lyrata TaxID=81972 RepID=UPI000A29A254|nr:uncharacterized protein LOC110224614 [Arabidopsis lyrata subsp. lyrata]|eukprot:XP_020866595.1 uncharacterized protein LOC110224614 [Arabidopsis lyrata subsp. lyrata]
MENSRNSKNELKTRRRFALTSKHKETFTFSASSCKTEAKVIRLRQREEESVTTEAEPTLAFSYSGYKAETKGRRISINTSYTKGEHPFLPSLPPHSHKSPVPQSPLVLHVLVVSAVHEGLEAALSCQRPHHNRDVLTL